VKEGEVPKRQKIETEIWKGGYNGGLVALKVLRVLPEDHRMWGIKSVSMSRGSPRAGLLAVALTDGVEVLQGSGVDEAARTPQHSPLLRGIDDRLRPLPSLSLV